MESIWILKSVDGEVEETEASSSDTSGRKAVEAFAFL